MDEQEFFSKVKSWCIENPQRILLPEAHDDRVIRAAEKLRLQGLVEPVLVYEKGGQLHDTVESIYAEPTPDHVDYFYEKRKHAGVSREDTHEKLKDPLNYALVSAGLDLADGVVCGANHSSAKTYRSALRILGSHENHGLVSSCFLMFWEDKTFFFADCALNINPDSKGLARIAESTVKTAEQYDISPRVAFLSYSTDGSASGSAAQKVKDAVEETTLDEDSYYGEVQFDAAFAPRVRERKHASFPYEDEANIYIFPDLSSGNIAYKVAERLGGAIAVGPITQGLPVPVNDLSRGSSVHDIIDTILLTAYHE